MERIFSSINLIVLPVHTLNWAPLLDPVGDLFPIPRGIALTSTPQSFTRPPQYANLLMRKCGDTKGFFLKLRQRFDVKRGGRGPLSGTADGIAAGGPKFTASTRH